MKRTGPAKSKFSGTCALCGDAVGKNAVAKHLDDCAPAHDVAGGPAETVGRFRVSAIGTSIYWLDVEARMSATLTSLDSLLRRTWLECCGHLSMFEIAPFRYMPVGAGAFDVFGGRDRDRSMSARIGAAFPAIGTKGRYEYDFGSTTALGIVLTGVREGRIGRSAARLLARNDPRAWSCGQCDQPATLVCCVHGTHDSPFVCARHRKTHPCEDRAFLPVVNSPRMGVCAYEG